MSKCLLHLSSLLIISHAKLFVSLVAAIKHRTTIRDTYINIASLIEWNLCIVCVDYGCVWKLNTEQNIYFNALLFKLRHIFMCTHKCLAKCFLAIGYPFYFLVKCQATAKCIFFAAMCANIRSICFSSSAVLVVGFSFEAAWSTV